VDKLVASLGDSVRVLGLGEPMHGANDFLVLRNRLFERLVEAHGFAAIAVESSFPRSPVANEFIAGQGPALYGDVQDRGFSHGFGRMPGNRDLIEWMRAYNADPAHRVKLQFYGFDGPMEMTHTDSPRQLLQVAVGYLASIDPRRGQERRERIEALLGDDAAWENPAAMMDPAKSVGLSSAAVALRIETEDFITELRYRGPELIAASDKLRYAEAVHYATSARQLLNYHAILAKPSSDRLVQALGVRDLMMADNLAYIVDREGGRGRVLAFAHNSHMKLGMAQWQLGPQLLAWWPAGAHLRGMLGSQYAVIGTGLGQSESQKIGSPEAATLESRLMATAGPARFVPTHDAKEFAPAAVAAIPTRSNSNPGYFPLTQQSLSEFDWLALMDSID
jgi:erythromycin esterase-like protein